MTDPAQQLEAYASIRAAHLVRCTVLRCRRSILPGQRMLLVRAVGWCCTDCAVLADDVDDADQLAGADAGGARR